ncbi:hypothetical protein FHA58_21265 [Escherichia coli]|uniref:hypothetical protein n=1 Tax=Escherichia coli TaxID=562 RepID=UPI001C70A4FF|nr:hypothetical protein [Escherichia coli]MBW9570965.1 hypothetical protein [Escherichia coli]MBY3015413.1 hypothetical protein [Escherichia coli]
MSASPVVKTGEEAKYHLIQKNISKVGLGEAAKMPAATALASSAGNITIPVLIGGVQRTALLQWKTLSVPQSTDGNMVVVDGSWRTNLLMSDQD